MTQSFMKVDCDSCGAELSIPEDNVSMKCGFCGTLNKPSLEEFSGKPSNKLRNLMLNAVKSENWEEAKKYSNNILEDDPTDYEAWIYKGVASGWNAKEEDPSKEILNCFRNAYANSNSEDTGKILNILSLKGTDLLLSLADSSTKFIQKNGFKGGVLWDAEVMEAYFSKIFGFIEIGYFLTEINRRDQNESLNADIDITFLAMFAYLFKYHTFTNMITKSNPFGLKLFDNEFYFETPNNEAQYDPQSKEALKWEPRVDEIIETYANNGYSLDDSKYEEHKSLFIDPREEYVPIAGCFVATAVYGDEDHFNLIVLRSFRDNFLRQYSMGRSFIAFYYEHGPKLADKVKESSLLKAIFTPLVETGVRIVRYFKLG
tara:strand:- start:1 stop:1119 length:1119 start_codon:yes stop_codon:yes gene_type:complete